ncbi:adenylosuccinate lyase-like [Schistocerca gregaria]|uniref:adenylosuccinate lyase-like n=1 Tax=Schistocerca gregaria TaxID=7010 RepID=UPI00211EEBC0|nr:adenylosuccinate lyase-like [Schistocerca gregaria]
MPISRLEAISPVDGRYGYLVEELKLFFSEKALMRYRLRIEIEYFIALVSFLKASGHKILIDVNIDVKFLRNLYSESNFNAEEAKKIKELEKVINHDVKAIEYYLKEIFSETHDENLSKALEFVHFGLTSQDVNNLAIPLAFKESMEIYYRNIKLLLDLLKDMSREWFDLPMLARTHGQPATPTSLGKEVYVWVYRIESQLKILAQIPHSGKFGGATGQFNAHCAAFKNLDWVKFADKFVQDVGLQRELWTTQISNYDNLAAHLHGLERINTILIDACRDFWQYILMEYFGQKIIKSEVGSSAMPHKVNPIDFECAEGNLLMANAIFSFLCSKLPISRLQRDLTDSTVLRNLGVPIAHTIIAIKVFIKGLKKLVLKKEQILNDLNKNVVVLSEAIQTILKREGLQLPYEAIKALTRTGDQVTIEQLNGFIETLDVSDSVKNELKALTPSNYIGQYPSME